MLVKGFVVLKEKLTEKQVKEKLDKADFFRAGKDVICATCGYPYGNHPSASGAEYLNELCDGTLIKL